MQQRSPTRNRSLPINEGRILTNQKRIEANQAKLLKNQKKLDQILANQKAILSKLS